jgi:hypothetical protein
MSDSVIIDNTCTSCHENAPQNECPKSERDCGHHCNHSWSHEECCWCNKTWGEEIVSHI